MQGDKSIEAQRERLLNRNKKSFSKAVSDKYVKKEILTLKYGLNNKKQNPDLGLKPFYYSLPVFALVFITSFFFFEIFNALLLAGSSVVISLIIFTQILKTTIKPQKIKSTYTLNPIFETYDKCIHDDIKDKLLSLKSLTEQLNQYPLTIEYQYYLESSIKNDIPSLFLNYSKLQENKSENLLLTKDKLLHQLGIIENKFNQIKQEYVQVYEKNIEVKSRVIKEKAAAEQSL